MLLIVNWYFVEKRAVLTRKTSHFPPQVDFPAPITPSLTGMIADMDIESERCRCCGQPVERLGMGLELLLLVSAFLVLPVERVLGHRV